MKKVIAGIPRRDTTHLFWKKFPYKVEVKSASKNFDYRCPKVYTNLQIWHSSNLNEASKRYQSAIKNLRAKYAQYLPLDRKTWKIFQTYASFHYYFLNKEDMECFVAGNSKNILAIFQPVSDNDVEILMAESDIYIRKTLFYNSYTYCIHFKYMDSEKMEELDQWVIDFFGEDEERYLYNNCGGRRLYLKNKDDILLTRIAFSQYILKVQKIVLRLENGSNVSA